MRGKNFSFIFAVLLCAGSLFVAPVYGQTQDSGNSDDWQFSGLVYLWGASIGGQSADGGDIDASFSDLLENLHFGFMAGFGAKKGKWGFMTDALFMDVEYNPNKPLFGNAVLRDLRVRSWVVTPQVTYRVVQSDRWDLDLLAGARYLYLKTDLLRNNALGNPVLKTDSGSVWDGIVGTRGKMKFDQNWYLPFHIDVGAGDTKLTWQGFAGVGYNFGTWDLVAGYRYLEWDFNDDDTGGGTFNDLNMSGPMLGAKFMF